MIFQTNWLAAGYPTECFQHGREITITKASYLCQHIEDEDAQPEDKAVIAVLVNILTSGNSKNERALFKPTVFDRSTQKRFKAEQAMHYRYILLFHDLFDNHNMFAIVLQSRPDFSHMFQYGSVSDLVTIGDAFVLFEPQGSPNSLGQAIPILQSVNRICGLNSTFDWPTTPIVKSTDPNRQICFHAKHKTIKIMMANLMTTKKVITCENTTCDRQNNNCKGCYGSKLTQWPIVLRCNVFIQETPSWDLQTGKAVFRDFQSHRFTKLFFQDLDEMSGLEKIGHGRNINRYRDKINQMVNYINQGGGWSIEGWHRAGVSGADPDDLMLSESTRGHLVLLKPTNPEVIQEDGYKALRIVSPQNELPDLEETSGASAQLPDLRETDEEASTDTDRTNTNILDKKRKHQPASMDDMD